MAGGFIPTERPSGAIDIEELAQADYALERALEHGDYDPLLARLRAGKGLPAEQMLLADIYEKRLKRKNNRPKSHPETLRFRDLHLALCVLDLWLKQPVLRLKKPLLKNAVNDTATQMGVEKSTVYGAIKQHSNLFHGLSK